MATCGINITSVSGQPQFASPPNCRTIVTVAGTVTTLPALPPCPAVMVTIGCQCGSSTCSVTGGVDSNGVLLGAALSGHLVGGQWQIVLQTSCCCDAKVDIVASCPAYTGCQAALTVLLPCATCCPKITLEPLVGECDASGQQTVTFIVKMDIPPGCPPVTAHMDFGDGSPVSASHSFTPPSSTFNWIHAYSNGTWNPQVVVTAPRDCPGKATSIIIQCPPKEDCCPKLWVSQEQGPCDSLGQAQVTLGIHYVVPDNCPPAEIQVDFGLGPLGAVHTISGSGTIVETHVYPAGSYTGAVLVIKPRGCRAHIFTVEVECSDCCPEVTAHVETGECVNGSLTATFFVNVAVPPGCPPAVVQIDFGDGSQGAQHSFAGSGSFTETHGYPTGSYPAAVNVLAPSGCPPKPVPVSVDCPDCCPTVSATADLGDCLNGVLTATFTVNVTVPKGCPPVDVQIDFGDGSHGALHSIAVSGSFTETHNYSTGSYAAAVDVLTPAGCPSHPVPIKVKCPPPDCCPTVTAIVEQGDCLNGALTATFTVTATVPPGCPPVVVQLDFGDGTLGAQHSIAGSGSFTETHGYPTGSYSASVNVLPPADCPPHSIPIKVECCCPTLSATVKTGECSDGSLTATFTVNYVVPKGCPPAVVQIDFGDGSVGGPHSIAGSGSFTETHSYASGSYSASVDVITPAGCPSSSPVPIKVECDDCCPDIATEVTYGRCNEDGSAVVTLITTVTPKPAPCPPAQVQVDFGGGNLGPVHTFAGPGSFPQTATFSAGPHSVAVNVLAPSGCKPKQVNVFVPCPDCCPSISVSPCIPDCGDAPDRTVEFQITVAPKGPPCPPKAVSFQMDFGDGTQGQSVTIPAGGGAYTYTETHIYSGAAALQDNNAELVVSQPPECAGGYGSVIVPKCCKPKRMNLCRTMFWSMSWAFTMALWFLLLWLFGSTIVASPQNVALTFAIIGVVLLILYLILCPKCLCGWVWRLLWRVFFGAALLYAIHAACAIGWWSLLIGVVLILIAFLVFLKKWRNQCCVSECDWLKEILFWGLLNILALANFMLANNVIAFCQFVLFTITIFNITFTITVLAVANVLFSLLGAYYLKQCPPARWRR